MSDFVKNIIKLARKYRAHPGNQQKPFLMGKGPYHNNPDNFDAIVPNNYQGQFQNHNKNAIIRRGIPLQDYIYVIKNFADIFLNSYSEGERTGRTQSYDLKYYGTDYIVNSRNYHVKIHVLMPTPIQIERSKKNPNPQNNQGVPKIKWIQMHKK